MRPPRICLGIVSAVLVASAVVLGGRQAEPDRARASSPTAERMATAATNLLAGLPPKVRAKANLKYDDPMRLVWHYYPTVAWQRTGVTLKELDARQKELFRGLLRAGTSEAGYTTARELMRLEGILADIENTPAARLFRDPERFHITVFGEPGAKGRWSWKLEGHHLVLNYVIQDGQIVSATPIVFGANPGRVPSGPDRGLRILAVQEDAGRRLYTALNADARRKATLRDGPPFDVLTNADTRAKPLPLAGLSHADMTAEQRKRLVELVKTYAGLLPDEVRDRLMERAGLNRARFAWAGDAEPGYPHYYRVNGPAFVIEYCNVQNGANHIHIVWRDYANDFGEK